MLVVDHNFLEGCQRPLGTRVREGCEARVAELVAKKVQMLHTAHQTHLWGQESAYAEFHGLE